MAISPSRCPPRGGGFLPERIPLDQLPPPWDRYVRVCRELPARYHGPDCHVRPWLDEAIPTREVTCVSSPSPS